PGRGEREEREEGAWGASTPNSASGPPRPLLPPPASRRREVEEAHLEADRAAISVGLQVIDEVEAVGQAAGLGAPAECDGGDWFASVVQAQAQVLAGGANRALLGDAQAAREGNPVGG